MSVSEHNPAPAKAGATIERDVHRRPGGFQGKGFCGVAHPDNPPVDTPEDAEFVFCRRQPHHDGSDHSAFKFSISVPETWPDERYHDLEDFQHA